MEDGKYAEKIPDSAYESNKIIAMLDSGWIQSEKVHNFLKSHFQFSEEEDDEDTSKDETDMKPTGHKHTG